MRGVNFISRKIKMFPCLAFWIMPLILLTSQTNSESEKAQITRSNFLEPEYVDLSYNLDEKAIFYPGQRFESFDLMKDIEGFNRTSTNALYWFAMYSFCMSEHGGTHLDAPFHFNKLGWRLAEIPLNRLVDVPAAVIDVEHHVFSLKRPNEFSLQVEHLLEHESKFGPIPIGSVILVRTGWSRFWPDKARYSGVDNSTGNPTYHFPGFSADAATWLVKEKQIIAVGIDTMSADIGNFKGNPIVHLILTANQVYIIENVANLGILLAKIRPSPQTRYPNQRPCDLRLFVLPIKSFGTGGPARVVAYCKY